VVSIEYQTGELVPEIPGLKNSTVDVRCTDENGRQFIVEMQLHWSEMFKSRVLLNASKAYVRQLDKAQSFNLLQPVYALNFVNEIFEHSPEMKDEYYHYYKIVNIKDTEKQIKGLEFLFVELPKFKPNNRAERKLHELWMRFLTEINERTEKVSPELLNNELTREAVEYMERSAYTVEQLEAYDKWKIDMMTERGLISDAEENGMKEGIEKGKIEGIQEGKIEGIQEGKAERNLEIARQAKAMNMPVPDIAKLTGLSEDEINKL
jgi:predicted transposase/invertase (TIGR01784 family)